jgi:hypothetical protein
VFALNAGAWPATREDPTEARDRYHRIALAEARTASEREPHSEPETETIGILDRVRSALGLATTQPDSVACCA